ncbi:MAG: hypothetical protein H0X02_12330, partial [Nitrosomonas sp.]|nr:hypothetical protein [Nitrosomonas sp.]
MLSATTYSSNRTGSLAFCLLIALPMTSTVTVTASNALAIITDMGVYPEPSLQPLPAAGSKIADPVFGSTIMRLTDGTDGDNGGGVQYSYLSAFNRDNTYIVVNENFGWGRARFFPFNATTFTAGSSFGFKSPPAGLREYWLKWSGVSPNLIFGTGDNNIWQINVATQQSTLVKDLSSQGYSGGYLEQVTVSQNDDVFAAAIVNGSGSRVGYLIYKWSTDQILMRNLVGNLDEVMVDKSGRYLIVVYNTGGGDDIYDLSTSPPTFITHLSGSLSFNHRDAGIGTVFSGTSGNALSYRQLATPTTITPMVPGYWAYGVQSDHFSLQADNESWAMSSRYNQNGGPVAKPFDNEIVQISTDGSNRVQRLAHHRSKVMNNNYDAQPKATISRDGRYIAFT